MILSILSVNIITKKTDKIRVWWIVIDSNGAQPQGEFNRCADMIPGDLIINMCLRKGYCFLYAISWVKSLMKAKVWQYCMPFRNMVNFDNSLVEQCLVRLLL